MQENSHHEIWLKGECAGISFQATELAGLKNASPCVMVCNRFDAQYEDAIVSAIIHQVTQDYVLITTNKKSASYLNDKHIVCVKKSALDSWSNIREAIADNLQAALEKGKSVVIFPSRPFTRFGFERINWDKEIVAAIQQMNVPVVPLFFKPKVAGAVALRSGEVPYRFLPNTESLEFNLRIGKAVKPEELEKFSGAKQFRRYLFTKTYALGSSLEVDKFYNATVTQKQEAIEGQVSVELLKKEIEHLQSFRVAEKGALETYICPTLSIPNVMKEIGVLRETTYREAGEGTGKKCDVDEYDLYYRQLFIWDKVKERIIGGYRLGCGDEIMNAYGRSGFYIHSLFRIDKEMDVYLKESLEMGRSFIIKDYQKEAFPLFLLWKSIFLFLRKNPQFRYLIGPVSISAEYSQFSQQLMVAFLRKHFYDKDMARYVKARNPFVEKLEFVKKKILLNQFEGIFTNLDKFIEDIEPKHFKVPVLIKQYIKQNSKFIGFNVDPAFSNAIDCLIMLDAHKLPGSTIENMS
jgi:putative hemolysin